MAYTKQNFTDGQVLNAEHLNKMETAIINLDTGLESTNLSAALAMKGSLKWDGVIGNKEYIFLQNQDGLGIGYVRVGDYPDLSLYLENADGEEIEIFVAMNTFGQTESEVIPATLLEDGLLMAEVIVCIPYDNYLLEGQTPFPKKGIYFMAYSALPNGIDLSIMYISALSMMGVSFEDSFDKYFQKKTTTKTANIITWDGNTMGLPNIGNQFFKVSDDIPTLADLQTGGTITMTVDGGTDTVDFTSDDIEISPDNQLILVKDCIYVLPSRMEIYPAGIYFSKINNQYISSFTINDYKFVVDKKTEEIIKTEHLPEALKFGDITTTTPTCGDTLTWDGNTDGLVYAVVMSDGTAFPFYKVSNIIITKDDCANGVVIGLSDGNMIEISSDDVQSASPDEAVNFKVAICAPYDNYNFLDMVTFPKAGIYFAKQVGTQTRSLTINGFTGFPLTVTRTVQIDPKYIPEHKHSYIVTNGTSDTLTWDGNTEGLENIVELVYKVSDAAPTLAELSAGGTIVVANGDILTTSSFSSDLVFVKEDGTIYIGNSNLPPVIIVDEVAAAAGEAAKGTYFVLIPEFTGLTDGMGDTWTASFTINGYTGFGTGKLDSKYLPDTVVQNGDSELILTSSGGKRFSITVSDNGTLTATEVTNQ